MVDLTNALRSPVARATVLLGAGLIGLTLTALLALRLPPAPGHVTLAPQIWLPADPVGIAPALLAEGSHPGSRHARPNVALDPAGGADRPPPAAQARSEEPVVHLAARPAPQPAPTLGFVPPPPRRPGSAPAPATSADLATRRTGPDFPSELDLALAPSAPGLARSPVPPARPQVARLIPPVRGTGASLLGGVGDRLDPPPRRPAAPARGPAPGTLALAARRSPAPDASEPPLAALPAPDLTAEVAPLAPRTGTACGPALARAIPTRPRGVSAGRAVLAALDGAGGTQRDAALIRAAEQGNIPDHLRQLVPVTLAGNLPDGRRAQIVICVMPDYLAIGDDRDFVRIPLGLPAANRLAERFDMLLPTARMVDAIHAQAQVRLTPSPMAPGAQMASTGYLVAHNATVESQRRAAGGALGLLVSGHKKDLVLSNRLTQTAGRVAIYGWHRANGQPIQPLSTVHGQNYADYSHGVRLISRTAFVNGRGVDLLDLLSDRRYAAILSGSEGPIATRQILAALR
jgi:hypothetical protein